MSATFTPLDYLGSLLRSPLGITNVERRIFPGGWSLPDEVILTNRYLLLLRGRIEYQVEGVATLLKPGQQVFVPNWVRRRWWVPSTRSCELLWCEFATERFESNLTTLFWRAPDDVALEEAALERMRAGWPGQRVRYEETGLAHAPGLSTAHGLRIEGELKASLARFWTEARPAAGVTDAASRELHPEIRTALRWLDEHFGREDALGDFYRQLTLSPNHFRLLFRQDTGCTVQTYLARLRLRRARYLIHETDWPLKRIAAAVGYADPFFFSRHYRGFWGHSPSVDRRQDDDPRRLAQL